MTRSRDRYIERLSALMPATKPASEESIAAMLKKAYIVKHTCKSRYTWNFKGDVKRRFYLFYARACADIILSKHWPSKSSRMKFFKMFESWAADMELIFEKLNFKAECDIHEIARMVWNESEVEYNE